MIVSYANILPSYTDFYMKYSDSNIKGGQVFDVDGSNCPGDYIIPDRYKWRIRREEHEQDYW